MATSLAEIRAKLQAQEARTGGQNAATGDNGIYPHWNIAENSTARLRFLPDADTNNSFFWVERLLIKLPFAGIKGQADSKPTVVQVPCMEMWNEPCPVLAEVRTWFKDKSLEEMGRKYWKKKSYLFQGFVRDNPIGDDKSPENPIRRFIISPQIFNLVKTALMDPELENLPTDYEGGLDFNVKKTSKGGYADYNTSSWSRKESALTAQERQAIELYGLYNLADFLPKKPGDAELKAIKEMFEASVNGEPYDPERWGQYFKPSGFNMASAPAASGIQPRPTAASSVSEDDVEAAEASFTSKKAVVEDDDAEPTAPVVAPAAAAKPASQRAEDILAMIRNRQK